MANWNGALSGAEEGASLGATVGSIIPGLGTAIGGAAGGLLGGVAGLFSSGGSTAPQNGTSGGGGADGAGTYQDSATINRQLIANKLMSAQTGEEYAAHQSALHQNRANELYDQASRDFGNNPAVSSSIYNTIQQNAENDNISSNIQGARINEDNMKTAADIQGQDRAANYMAQKDALDRASKPSILEQALGQGITSLVGSAAGGAGRGIGKLASNWISGGGSSAGDNGGSGSEDTVPGNEA